MDIAGPSRERRAPRRVENTYEEDLLGFLRGISPDEVDRMQTYFAHVTRAGDLLSDHDMALNDLLQQARGLAIFDQDRVLAQRITAGEDVDDEGPALARPNGLDGTGSQRNDGREREERAVSNDTAPSLSRGEWFFSMIRRIFDSRRMFKTGPGNARTSTALRRVSIADHSPTGHSCVVCQDPIHGAEIHSPCGHYHDIACITNLFRSATLDETLFPPRCCGENIPLTQVQPYLSQSLVATFHEKQDELGTLKRVYCSSPMCSRFLGPLSEDIGKVYRCPAPGCRRRTCAKCRRKYSVKWMHACCPDANTTRVLELGRTSGWTHCPSCSHMIERTEGCNHMTCRCHTEFCYPCGTQWKECQCPLQDM